MASTHARWLADQADACVAALLASGRRADCTWYANVAHQMAQAWPSELREFVLSYPRDKAMVIAPLMVLAWRIVGNEFKGELSQRASEEIGWLCDIDEWERAVEAIGDGSGA
jgi:hypothetical protein